MLVLQSDSTLLSSYSVPDTVPDTWISFIFFFFANFWHAFIIQVQFIHSFVYLVPFVLFYEI